MSAARLTDDQLRAAAARRPGYATYAEYRPSSSERLARLQVRPTDGSAFPVTVRRPASVSAERPPVVRPWLDARLPPPPTTPTIVTLLASLPPARVFDFQPRLIDARPWWQPRWHWCVLAADGGKQLGYAWTEASAHRRTARAARRAAR